MTNYVATDFPATKNLSFPLLHPKKGIHGVQPLWRMHIALQLQDKRDKVRTNLSEIVGQKWKH